MQSSDTTKVKQVIPDASGKDAGTKPQNTTLTETDTVSCTGAIEIGAKPDLWGGLRNSKPIRDLRCKIPENLYADGEKPDRRPYEIIVREIYPQFFDSSDGILDGIRQAIRYGSIVMLVYMLCVSDNAIADELTISECDRAYWLLQVAKHDPELRGCFNVGENVD